MIQKNISYILSNPSNKLSLSIGSESLEVKKVEDNNEYSITVYTLNKFKLSKPSNTIVFN